MNTEFTPLLSFLGGSLIGLAAVLLMLGNGRIMGATGVLTGLVQPANFKDWSWRFAVLLGMISGPVVVMWSTGSFPVVNIPITTPFIFIGGLLVGTGVSFGGGCTSGHGVCGMARLSERSLVATLAFMLFALLTVYIVRHVLVE